MTFMGYLQIITYIVAFYGAYVSFMSLRWISNDTGHTVFAHEKYLKIFRYTFGSAIFLMFIWFSSYIGINEVHKSVARGVLPGEIEMTWRLGHLCVNLTLIRVCQAVLYFEKCEKIGMVVPWWNVSGHKRFRLPIFYNTLTNRFF